LLRLEWLKQGKIDLFYEGSNACQYLEGKRPEEIERNRGPLQMRISASAHTGTSGFMVRGDSPIKTIYDIGPDTRIATCNMMAEGIYALLAWLKLNKGPIPENPKDAEWKATLVRFNSWEANLKSVAEGTADIAAVTAENPLVKEAAEGPHGIRFLELPAKDDPEGLARFKHLVPFGKIAPAPEYGAKEIWGVTTLSGGGTACLWCRPDFDADLGYELTRWFDENYELYKDKGNKLKTYTLESLRQTLDTAMVPVHDGTARYFKEKGLWGEADDARGEYNLKLITWYCEAWETAIARADAKGIAVGSTSQEWMELWSDYKKEIRLPHIKPMTDEEIKEGLAQLRSLGR